MYTQIGYEYSKNARNIKENIMIATDFMYAETKIEKLKEYFSINKDKKTTPKLIISTVLEKIKN